MDKIIILGDSLLDRGGIPEAVLCEALCDEPNLGWDWTLLSRPDLDTEKALVLVPRVVISLSPQIIYLGLGYPEIIHGLSPDKFGKVIETLLILLRSKTQANVYMGSLCTALFRDSMEKQELCRLYNLRLIQLFHEHGIFFIDVDSEVNHFLEGLGSISGTQGALVARVGEELRLTRLAATLMAKVIWNGVSKGD